MLLSDIYELSEISEEEEYDVPYDKQTGLPLPQKDAGYFVGTGSNYDPALVEL
jgi:hypothetical protein